MLLKYFYHDKLAHASYLVGCEETGEAIVVDPGRTVEAYLSAAEANDLRIVAAAETHIHADFVSGSRELADRVGAKLYLSDEGDKDWKYGFATKAEHQLVRDGDTFNVGHARFTVVYTPGHTPEHVCFLLTDSAGAALPMGIFTGDFVFVGSLGRPDLLETAAGAKDTANAGARQIFRSLHRFNQLPDYLQVWPAHGAGSACGKDMGSVPSSTVGYEKRFNPMLQFEDETRFVAELLEGQPESPPYFAVMKQVNKEGPRLLKDSPFDTGQEQTGQMETMPEQMLLTRLPDLVEAGATVVDTRPGPAFARRHFPGTINIPPESMAQWAGWLLSYDRPYYLIADAEQLQDALANLAYIGLDQLGGVFVPESLDILAKQGYGLDTYDVASPEELAEELRAGRVTLLDVRSAREWDDGHVPGARHVMLGHLPEHADSLVDGRPIAVHCLHGPRSAIGASILKAHGADKVFHMDGGFDRWQKSGLPVT